MTATNKLALELLQNAAANQTLANITFAQLNQLVQAAVLDKDLTAPPGSPANEALYIIASPATGDWTGRENQLAYWLTSTGAWQYIAPKAGWQVAMLDEVDGAGQPARYSFTGAAWAAMSGGGLSNPMTTIRDMIVGGVGGIPTRLPGPSSEGMVLTRIGTALAWAIATGFANPMTAAGDLIIGGAAGAATRLAIGAEGRVLTVVGGVLTWATVSDSTKLALAGGRMTGAINEALAPVWDVGAGSVIGADIVSSANTIQTVGSAALAGMADAPLDSIRRVVLGGNSQITQSSTFNLFGSANIAGRTGDVLTFRSVGTASWKMIDYARFDGTPLVTLVNAVTSVAGRTGAVVLAKADVGLPNADNTADNVKPVSAPQQAALDLKAPVASPAFTGNGTIAGSLAAGSDSPLRLIGTLGASIQHLKSAAGGQLDIDDVPFTSADQSLFRFHRNINTSGNIQVAFHRGNGSTAVDHSLKSAGSNAATTSEAIFGAGGGKVAVGTSAVDATATLLVGGAVSANGPIKPGQYTLTTLPSASVYNGYEIDVTNSTVAPAGPKRCRSNGTVWQILNTTTTVS